MPSSNYRGLIRCSPADLETFVAATKAHQSATVSPFAFIAMLALVARLVYLANQSDLRTKCRKPLIAESKETLHFADTR